MVKVFLRAFCCACIALSLTAGDSKKKEKTVYAEDLLATFSGTVRTNSGKKLVIADPDNKILEFHATRKTEYFNREQKIRAGDVKPGDRVAVDAKQFPDGELETVRVHVLPKASPR